MNGIDKFGSPLFKNYQDSYTSHNESILRCNGGNNCFDAKQRRIVNVGKPINKQDVVNLESLGQCLSLDDEESYFDAKNKKISNVASPEFSTDAVDLYTLINHVSDKINNTTEIFNESLKKLNGYFQISIRNTQPTKFYKDPTTNFAWYILENNTRVFVFRFPISVMIHHLDIKPTYCEVFKNDTIIDKNKLNTLKSNDYLTFGIPKSFMTTNSDSMLLYVDIGIKYKLIDG